MKNRPKVKLTAEQRRQENIKFILDNQNNVDELVDEEYKMNFTNVNLQGYDWREIRALTKHLKEGLRLSENIYYNETIRHGRSE